MILADTSVWVDHLRGGEPRLAAALDVGQVWMHPFVLGELACGALHNHAEVLTLLSQLPAVPIATDAEVLAFIDKRSVWGRGIGWVDAHLLAATALAVPVRLWTKDRRLAAVAGDLGLAVSLQGRNP